MTLAEVAARVRTLCQTPGTNPSTNLGRGETVNSFEADPDFKLRERVEQFFTKYGCSGPGSPASLPPHVARELREILDPPKIETPEEYGRRMDRLLFDDLVRRHPEFLNPPKMEGM